METDASSEPITTGRAPIGYDAVGEVVTMEDPGRGNIKTAAGNATSAGNPKNALPYGSSFKFVRNLILTK